MIDRRSFLGAVTVVWVPSAAMAQAGRTFTIGYLAQGKVYGSLPMLLAHLRRLGYVDGRNLAVEARLAEHPDELSRLAAELVRANPRLIAVPSAGIARIVLERTTTIPVVALHAGQLQAEPRVASLAKPGGNLTGMQLHSPETIGKRLQLLQEVVPSIRRVAVLRGVPFEGPGLELYRDANDAAAAKLGIRARYLEFDQPAELDRLFEDMTRERDQALVVWSNPHLNANRARIIELTFRHRLPAVWDVRLPGSTGELLVYSAKLDDVLREAATYVDRILKGARPGDLPIGQARSFELIVDLKTARAIGVTIPPTVRQRADEVVE